MVRHPPATLMRKHYGQGAQLLIMKNKKLIRFVHSLIVLPIILINPVSLTLAPTPEPEPVVEAVKMKAEAIDRYFELRGMPMAGLGMKLVEEAQKNDLDWRLLAAIAVRESTGGKFKCKKAQNNPFGWGSCKISFSSYEKAIETVALNLGGNNPNTAHHYDEKTTKQILRAYNPPSIVPRYAEQVINIMDTIAPMETQVLAKANT